MNIRRAALYAFVFGLILIVAGPLILRVYTPILGAARDVFGLGPTYFGIRTFFNFLTGGALNFVALEAFLATVILLGLGRRVKGECCQ